VLAAPRQDNSVGQSRTTLRSHLLCFLFVIRELIGLAEPHFLFISLNPEVKLVSSILSCGGLLSPISLLGLALAYMLDHTPLLSEQALK